MACLVVSRILLTIFARIAQGLVLPLHGTLARSSSLSSRSFILDPGSGSEADGELARVELGDATTSVSNLGGLGPDFASPQKLIFSNATTYKGHTVDMEITALTPYQGNTTKNRIWRMYGMINVASGTEVTLRVQLVDHVTKVPVVVDRLRMAVWDLDVGFNFTTNAPFGYEAILAGPLVGYHLTNTTQLIATREADSYYYFNATKPGFFEDNPHGDEDVTQEQKDKAVVLEMTSLSAFRLKLFAHIPSLFGRTFLLGGVSGLADEATLTRVGPCSNYLNLDFTHSRLVSTSIADGGLRYTNVSRFGGQSVDLVISADTGYAAWNTSHNRLVGSCAGLNLAAGVSTQLRFSFLDSATNARVALGRFFFSVLDVDSTLKGGESFEINKAVVSRYWLSSESSIQATTKGDMLVFSSKFWGSAQNNPTDPLRLTHAQKSLSVTFFFDKEITEFTMLVHASEFTKPGRNIFFAGLSSIPCQGLS